MCSVDRFGYRYQCSLLRDKTRAPRSRARTRAAWTKRASARRWRRCSGDGETVGDDGGAETAVTTSSCAYLHLAILHTHARFILQNTKKSETNSFFRRAPPFAMKSPLLVRPRSGIIEQFRGLYCHFVEQNCSCACLARPETRHHAHMPIRRKSCPFFRRRRRAAPLSPLQ